MKIYLESNTGTKHLVDYNSIILSEIIKDMLEDADKNSDEEIIPLLNLSDDIIIKIIEYCDYYISDPHDSKSITRGNVINSSDPSKYLTKWYVDFINIDINFLGILLKASNFLNIEPLIELCCFKFATLFKGKTPETLKEEFGEDSIITEEEKSEFLQAHTWNYEQQTT